MTQLALVVAEEDPVDLLTAAARSIVTARADLKDVIALAREAGLGWPVIARCLREGGLHEAP